MDKVEIPLGNRTFRALTSGPDQGRTVVLLHGFPQSAGEWRAQLDVLGTAGFRCVAPDQRGYSPGARPSDVAEYGIAQNRVGIADHNSSLAPYNSPVSQLLDGRI